MHVDPLERRWIAVSLVLMLAISGAAAPARRVGAACRPRAHKQRTLPPLPRTTRI